MASQNNEEQILLEYFSGTIPVILSIGENDGVTISNTRALIERGSPAVLVEPANTPFNNLSGLYLHRDDVYCYKMAVGDKNGKATLYESGSHFNNGDLGLLSSLKKSETTKWLPTTTFTETEVDVVDFKTLLKLSPYKIFDLIAIDAEGFDLDILKQIDLDEVKCHCLCIEWNSNQKVLEGIINHCNLYGLSTELLRNVENIILCR